MIGFFTLPTLCRLQNNQIPGTGHELIAGVEANIARLSVTDSWAELMPFLIQLTGVGLYTGMTISRPSATSDASPAPSNWLGMLASALAFLLRARPTAPEKSPNKDDANFAQLSSPVHGPLFAGRCTRPRLSILLLNALASTKR